MFMNMPDGETVKVVSEPHFDADTVQDALNALDGNHDKTKEELLRAEKKITQLEDTIEGLIEQNEKQQQLIEEIRKMILDPTDLLKARTANFSLLKTGTD